MIEWLIALIATLLISTSAQVDPIQEHCVRQMTWDTTLFADGGAWVIPDDSFRALVDLRGSSQLGPGPIPEGYVIATYDGLGQCTGPDVVAVWSDMQQAITVDERLALEFAFKRPGGLGPVDTWEDLVIALITVKADPTGTTFSGQRLANQNMVVYTWLGDTQVAKKITLDSPEWQTTLNGLQHKYKILYDKAQNGILDLDAHRHALWLWENKYKGVDWQDFVHPDRPAETPIKPPARGPPVARVLSYPMPTLLTVTDTFEADTSANWTAGSGTFTIDSGGSGFLEPTGTELVVQHDTDMGCDVHYAETTINAIGSNYQGAMVRKDSTAGTLTYWTMLQQGTGNNTVQLFWRNAGSYNQRQSEAHTFSADELYRLDIDSNDDLVMTIDAVAQGSPHSAAVGEELTGNVDHGLVSNTTTTNFADYEAVDDCAAPPTRRIILIS